jgi:hypothetical protein
VNSLLPYKSQYASARPSSRLDSTKYLSCGGKAKLLFPFRRLIKNEHYCTARVLLRISIKEPKKQTLNTLTIHLPISSITRHLSTTPKNIHKSKNRKNPSCPQHQPPVRSQQPKPPPTINHLLANRPRIRSPPLHWRKTTSLKISPSRVRFPLSLHCKLCCCQCYVYMIRECQC